VVSYEKHHCWSLLLRLFHVMFALSIIFLVVTGFYINNPWTNNMIEGSGVWPMAYMRYIHFLAAYTFSSAVLIRFFLYIFGNKQERIWDILPVTPRNLKNLFRTLMLYSYISDRHDDRLGHNILAGSMYLITFFAALFMILSGFYMLYPEVSFVQGLGVKLLGSQQWGRFLHHCMMWWFMIFAVIHIYFVIWNDIRGEEGLISSIFTGVKFKHKAEITKTT
jgi:Ni/Fe-hydrogenase 1 B-type cytochrome subunit